MSLDSPNNETVDRPRLTTRFREGLTRRLTLVEAPLGYGKTTLISAWKLTLEKDNAAISSVSFENVTRNKFERVIEAVANLGLHYDKDVGLTPMPDRAEYPEDRFLILDDFHEADDQTRSFVQDVLRGAQHRLHIVIGSRETPGFPLTKLRMADQVNDFGLADLRFDMSETQELFKHELPIRELQGLLDRTEGWIAALHLLRQFGVGHDGSPPDFEQLTQFGEYLNEQYFEQLEPAHQHLLMHTAHVDHVDGDLANRLTLRDDCWQLLATLASANALIIEETETRSTRYRYHSLLRDYLRRKQQQLGEARLARLHQETSDWFSQKDALFEAMHHASLAGDLQRAESLLLEAGGVQYGMLHGAGGLAACLDVLADEQVVASPRLLLVRAYVLLKTGRIREGTDLIETVRSRHGSGGEELEREIILLEAHARVYADAEMSYPQLEALEHALSITPPVDSLTRGMLSNFLCMFLIEFGEFAKAREYGELAMSLYQDINATHLQFFMYLHLSAIDLEIDALPPAHGARGHALSLCQAEFASDPSLRAIAEIYHGETLFEAGETAGLAERLRGSLLRIDKMEGWNMLYLAGYETCLSLLIEEGELDAAVEICEHAGNLVARRGMIQFSKQLLCMQLDLAVRAGAWGEARRLVREVSKLFGNDDSGGSLRWRGRIRAELAISRFEAENNAEHDALDRINRAIVYCEAKGLTRLRMRALVRKFCIEAKLEQETECLSTLREFLELARDHKSFGAVLRERAAFAKSALWLVATRGLGIFDAADIRILALSLWKASGRGDQKGANILNELLSEKEAVVLNELAKGQANKVIARSLGVTEPTIKFHLQNIYRKLGVNTRKLAAEIALLYGKTGH